MKKVLLTLGVSVTALLMTGCGGGGYNSYYVAPQSQEKDLDQVAKDSVSHLSAKETAQLNKLSEKK